MKKSIFRFIPVRIIALIALPYIAAAANAQTLALPRETNRSPNCEQSAAQFDFLVGEWDVFDDESINVGRNSITPIASGCGLSERWSASDGLIGQSMFVYDRYDRLWHQYWIDSNGSSLNLAGKFQGSGNVRLTGLKPNTNELHEISWRKVDDDTIEQVWRMSLDQGKTWLLRFQGIYHRRAMHKD